MKGQAEIIDGLNGALTVELTAINQYFCQSKMCADWGFHNLAKKHHEESIGEMKHAEKLIERILFLEGRARDRPLRRHPGRAPTSRSSSRTTSSSRCRASRTTTH